MSRVNHGPRQNTATNPEALSQIKAIPSVLQAEGGVYDFQPSMSRSRPDYRPV